jgi:glucose-1-phosphate thymidylyltransferase
MLLVKEHAETGGFGQLTVGQQGLVSGLSAALDSIPGRDALVGIVWHGSSRQLLRLASQASPQPLTAESRLYFSEANQVLLSAGAKVGVFPAFQWSDTSSLTGLLQANTRLLSVGLHSADAIERSYAEDFTVLPPVYLHPDARVRNAVIGPYASIEAGATISNAVVRHSVIDAGAGVANCVLDGSLVGENAHVVGRPKSLLITDNSSVELG